MFSSLQVHDLAASALAAGNLDAAALLAKLQASSSIETDLHRLYEHDNLQSLQHEPMELTSGNIQTQNENYTFIMGFTKHERKTPIP